MARKKTKAQPTPEVIAPVQDQLITDTIEKNYMPYVMSVIVSRAIPEIDGFKPAHRKILYTMYKMGLMHGARTKSANVVGQTMHVHPHGDMAIYETLVRLTRANEALLHPFVDSKGSFGKQYSRDMAFSAPRYTEVKLDPFCAELFAGIEKNAVEMVPNYDNTMVEPTLLPTTFPNILVSPNMGIAVGMASQICSFNLAEICDGTIALLKNPKTNHFSAGFTDEERGKFTELLNSGFSDTFRSLYPDKVEYSWWSYMFQARQKNVGWRIDYFVVSSRIMDKVKEAKIHTEIMGSDHCPVSIEIDI